MRAPHERDVEAVACWQVVDVAALALDEPPLSDARVVAHARSLRARTRSQGGRRSAQGRAASNAAAARSTAPSAYRRPDDLQPDRQPARW